MCVCVKKPTAMENNIRGGVIRYVWRCVGGDLCLRRERLHHLVVSQPAAVDRSCQQQVEEKKKKKIYIKRKKKIFRTLNTDTHTHSKRADIISSSHRHSLYHTAQPPSDIYVYYIGLIHGANARFGYKT